MQKSIDTALKVLNDKVFENVNYLASNKDLPDMIVSSIEEETENVRAVIKLLENFKEMLKPKPIKVEPYEVEAVKRFGLENVLNSKRAVYPKMNVIIKTEEQDK